MANRIPTTAAPAATASAAKARGKAAEPGEAPFQQALAGVRAAGKARAKKIAAESAAPAENAARKAARTAKARRAEEKPAAQAETQRPVRKEAAAEIQEDHAETVAEQGGAVDVDEPEEQSTDGLMDGEAPEEMPLALAILVPTPVEGEIDPVQGHGELSVKADIVDDLETRPRPEAPGRASARTVREVGPVPADEAKAEPAPAASDRPEAAQALKADVPPPSGHAAPIGPAAPAAISAPAAAPTAATVPVPPDATFAGVNHPRIVQSIRIESGSNNTMQIRLDPPELGALQVKIEMRDGALTASFQTSNDEATRLLSHSLAQLKNTLESHGVSVAKLQVQQAPREESASNQPGDEDRGQQNPQHSSQQEQQRRELLDRMWRRLGRARNPFDVVA